MKEGCRHRSPGDDTCSTCGDFDVIRELILLIRSRYALICLDTVEEDRAESLLKHLADSMNLPFFTWTLGRGLQRADVGKPVYATADPKQALDHIELSEFPAIYHFQGLGALLDDALLGAKLAQAARRFTKIEGALVLTGTEVKIPEAVKPHTAYLKLPPPARRDYAQLLEGIYRDLSKKREIKVEMSKQEMNRLLNDLSGLTLLEAGKILTKAMIEDGRLSHEDLKLVIEAKKRIVEREGLLEYFPVEERMADVADLAQLKAWLAKRKNIIDEPERATRMGLSFPKGILLLGVPGSGKSLCAKSVAMEWTLPLLKMDPSNLYNKYIGETEKNFKRAMDMAETMSPVVLWIDEIEKVLAAGDQEDGGVSLRVLGMFLSWLQDRRGDVFVVATSNDVQRLPPELLRKGRFDEIFFVDLPDQEARAAIFRIHLKRRGHDPERFALPRLAAASEGFSGAEIEQAVVAALYTAFAGDRPLSNEILLEECGHTNPLSRTRAEYIRSLRKWATGRTVSAQ
ncbi:MAG TPA: AAA family ATPase [Syntrophobacteria bacterium]|nr:AAA family ATPase [Syntrophobacteria bacterium]